MTLYVSADARKLYVVQYREMFEFQVALCVGVLVPERPERGGPCYHVETEVKDSRCKYERVLRVLPLLVRWPVVPIQEIFLSCLSCSSQPSNKNFSWTHTISLHLSPAPSKLGSGHAVAPHRLSMCLLSIYSTIYIRSTETSQLIK